MEINKTGQDKTIDGIEQDIFYTSKVCLEQIL